MPLYNGVYRWNVMFLVKEEWNVRAQSTRKRGRCRKGVRWHARYSILRRDRKKVSRKGYRTWRLARNESLTRTYNDYNGTKSTTTPVHRLVATSKPLERGENEEEPVYTVFGNCYLRAVRFIDDSSPNARNLFKVITRRRIYDGLLRNEENETFRIASIDSAEQSKRLAQGIFLKKTTVCPCRFSSNSLLATNQTNHAQHSHEPSNLLDHFLQKRNFILFT